MKNLYILNSLRIILSYLVRFQSRLLIPKENQIPGVEGIGIFKNDWVRNNVENWRKLMIVACDLVFSVSTVLSGFLLFSVCFSLNYF